MRNKIRGYLGKNVRQMRAWARENILGLFLLNAVLLVVVMLRSVGYFAPFLPLGVNLVFLIGLILSVVLLGGRSRYVFFVALLFWFLAGFFRIVGVGVWAERAAIYTFEAVVVGVVLLVIEGLRKERKGGA